MAEEEGSPPAEAVCFTEDEAGMVGHRWATLQDSPLAQPGPELLLSGCYGTPKMRGFPGPHPLPGI